MASESHRLPQPRLDFSRATRMVEDENNQEELQKTRTPGQPRSGSVGRPPSPPGPPTTQPRSVTWRLQPFAAPLSTRVAATSAVLPPASTPFQPNFLLRVTQLLAAAQGALGLVTGINLVRGAVVLNDVSAGVNLSGAPRSTASSYAISTFVIAVMLILAGFLIGRPSTIARVVVWLWAGVAFCVSLAAFLHGGSVLGFVTVAVFAASGGAILPAPAVLSIDAVMFYALAVHPATYSAFRERGAATSWNAPPIPPYRSAASRLITASAASRASADAPAPPTPATTELATAPPIAAPSDEPDQKHALVTDPSMEPHASPHRRVKLPRRRDVSKTPTAPPEADECSTRASAPTAQARDYSPPSRAANDQPADAEQPPSHDGEPSE